MVILEVFCGERETVIATISKKFSIKNFIKIAVTLLISLNVISEDYKCYTEMDVPKYMSNDGKRIVFYSYTKNDKVFNSTFNYSPGQDYKIIEETDFSLILRGEVEVTKSDGGKAISNGAIQIVHINKLNGEFNLFVMGYDGELIQNYGTCNKLHE